MGRSLALFFAALIATTQAAPVPADENTAALQTGSNAGSSPNGSVSGTGSGGSGTASGTAGSPGITLIIPPELFSSFGLSGGNSGASTGTSTGTNTGTSTGTSTGASTGTSVGIPTGSSGTSSSSNSENPIAAIISIIPNTLLSEQKHIAQTFDTLINGNVDPITDSIDRAATTGGKFLSNGVKLIGAWPRFFGQLLG